MQFKNSQDIPKKQENAIHYHKIVRKRSQPDPHVEMIKLEF